MFKKVTCDKCKSILEYDDKSVWEGNRDFEDITCPICKKIVATFGSCSSSYQRRS